MRVLFVILLVFSYIFPAFAQGSGLNKIAIGQWRSHLDYSNGQKIAEMGDRIVCGTRTGIFIVNPNDNSVDAVSKEDGFSDIRVRTLAYYAPQKVLCIAYDNANMDFVFDKNIINVREILNKEFAGIKEINAFDFKRDTLFISTTFGVVEYILTTRRFGESYITGSNINSVSFLNDSIFVAMPNGVIKAPYNSMVRKFLRDPQNWDTISTDSCTHVKEFGGRMWGIFPNGNLKYWQNGNWITHYTLENGINALDVNYGKLLITGSKTVGFNSAFNVEFIEGGSANHAILDAKNNLWQTSKLYPCVRINFNTANPQAYFYKPNGPSTHNAYRLTSYGNNIYAASSGLGDFGQIVFTNAGFYHFNARGEWENYHSNNTENWPEGMDGISEVKTDPLTKNLWISSLTHGLAEFNNSKIINVYNGFNSTLQPRLNDSNPNFVAVSGVDFDSKGNMWVANFQAFRQIAKRSRDGKWESFNLGNKKWTRTILVDTIDQVWSIMPRDPAGAGMLVYEPTNAKLKLLDNSAGSGNLPSTTVNAIVEDKQGQIWVGTNDGVAVFYNPFAMFSNQNSDAQRVIVRIDNEPSYLLSGETVTAIAVDGANRKWVGTTRGVWLLSADGNRIIESFDSKFNPANGKYGPLISDNIRSIAVNGVTGEVFFSTELGIISYRSTATEGGGQDSRVYAFPNPVRPNYAGPIAINGLPNNALVKITDVTGNLVFETKANGNQAIWYGKNFKGEAAASGVYIVMSSNDEGTEKAVTKILIVR